MLSLLMQLGVMPDRARPPNGRDWGIGHPVLGRVRQRSGASVVAWLWSSRGRLTTRGGPVAVGQGCVLGPLCAGELGGSGRGHRHHE